MSLFRAPRFRNSDRSINWPQWADMIIPGNIYNSHTNEYRPLGIAQGLTGIPVDTLHQLYQEGVPMVRGGIAYIRGMMPYGSSANLGPVALGGRPAPIPLDAWGNPLSDIGIQDQSGQRGNATPWQMPGTSGGERNPVSSRLGLGVLGSAGDAAVQYYSNNFGGRGGALMER